MNRTPFLILFVLFSLFGLAFVCLGLHAFSETAATAGEWRSLQSWRETPARILSVEWVEQEDRDSEGRIKKRFEVRAEFEYSAAGETHRGSRVDIYPFPDSFRSYHARQLDRLQQARNEEVLFRCFVNPADPREAVLFRDFHWQWFFLNTWGPGAFCLIGLGLLYLAWMSLSILLYGKKEERLKTTLPIPPPQDRGCYIFVGKKKKRGAILLAAFVILFFFPGSVLAFSESQSLQDGKAVLGMVLGLACLAAVTFAVHRARQCNKFGDSVLVLSTDHAGLGTNLTALIYVASVFPNKTECRLSVSCEKFETFSQDTTTRTVMWETQETVQAQVILSGVAHTQIPVRFSIPERLPATSPDTGSTWYKWRLKATAVLEGPDYFVEFEIPVLAETPVVIRPDLARHVDSVEPPATSPSNVPLIAGVTVLRLSNGYRLEFSRDLFAAIIMTAAALLMLRGTYVFYQQVGQWSLLSLLAALSGYFVYAAINHWLGTQSLEIGPHAMIFYQDLPGISRVWTYAQRDIVDLQPVDGPVIFGRQRFCLRFTLGSGRTFTWGASFQLEEAQKLIALIQAVGERGA